MRSSSSSKNKRRHSDYFVDTSDETVEAALRERIKVLGNSVKKLRTKLHAKENVHIKKSRKKRNMEKTVKELRVSFREARKELKALEKRTDELEIIYKGLPDAFKGKRIIMHSNDQDAEKKRKDEFRNETAQCIKYLNEKYGVDPSNVSFRVSITNDPPRHGHAPPHNGVWRTMVFDTAIDEVMTDEPDPTCEPHYLKTRPYNFRNQDQNYYSGPGPNTQNIPPPPPVDTTSRNDKGASCPVSDGSADGEASTNHHAATKERTVNDPLEPVNHRVRTPNNLILPALSAWHYLDVTSHQF